MPSVADALRDLAGDGPHVETAARSLRRLIAAAIMDRQINEDDLREEFHRLMQTIAQSRYHSANASP